MDKHCTACETTKSIDHFNFRNDTKTWRNECKECLAKINKEYRAKRKENNNQPLRQDNVIDNNHSQCIMCKSILNNDMFRFRKDTQKMDTRCNDCMNEYVRNYRKSEEFKQKDNARRKQRYKIDEAYAMKERLRARIRKVLKAQDATKYASTLDLLGCDLETFKTYIESRFDKDMSWEKRNFEIDHKIPCAAFDLTNIEHQKICFHYRNLQPLSPKDNNAKRDAIMKEYLDELPLEIQQQLKITIKRIPNSL